MAQLDEALKLYRTLCGEEMPHEQQKDLLSVKATLGLSDNDSLFAVFVALGYYQHLYKQIPLSIANEKSTIEKMLEERLKTFSETINQCADKSIETAGEVVIKHYQTYLQQSKKDALEEQKQMFLECAKTILEDNAKKINERSNEAYNIILEKEQAIMQYTYRKTLFIAALVSVFLIAIGFIGGKYHERGMTVQTSIRTSEK